MARRWPGIFLTLLVLLAALSAWPIKQLPTWMRDKADVELSRFMEHHKIYASEFESRQDRADPDGRGSARGLPGRSSRFGPGDSGRRGVAGDQESFSDHLRHVGGGT